MSKEVPVVVSIEVEGPGDECETCGWSDELIEFKLYKDNSIYLYTTYGCYGGTVTEDPEEALKELAFVRDWILDDDINEIEQIVRSVQ